MSRMAHHMASSCGFFSQSSGWILKLKLPGDQGRCCEPSDLGSQAASTLSVTKDNLDKGIMMHFLFVSAYFSNMIHISLINDDYLT